MHTTLKRLLSVLLVVCMLCGTASATQIRPQEALKQDIGDAEIIYEEGDVLICTYEDTDGNIILCEYTNGVLTQRNTVFSDIDTYYQREIFGEEPVCELVNIGDYGTTQTSYNLQGARAASSTKNGVIQFRANTNYGYVYYKLNCVCEETYIGQTTYTVESFTGKVVDLVTILIDALILGDIVALLTNRVLVVLANLGISVTGGVIESQFTDTFSCIRTDYYWSFADSNTPEEEKHQTGSKYYITDELSDMKGENMYEGYTADDWRSSGLAVRFHNMVYAYTDWQVIGWSALG